MVNLPKQGTLKCPKCNHTEFSIEENPKNTDLATCTNCGAETTYGKLKTIATNKYEKLAKSQFEKELKKRVGKHFKFK